MKETNYWKQFLSTGKVEDYLCYRAQEEQKEQCDGRKGARDAGLRGSDRDRIEGRFHWGI